MAPVRRPLKDWSFGARLFLGYVAIWSVVGIVVWWRFSENADATAHRTNNALCALRADYQNRLTLSQEFLKLTPAQRVAKYGPTYGAIPRTTIIINVSNLQRTIDALSSLKCEEPT